MHALARRASVLIAATLLCLVGRHLRAADQADYAHAVVAADHPLASAAGVEILKQGGNVVDAAVATGFALSVVRPASSGIGGGGFMVIWDAAKGRGVAIDYREQAPLKATRDMYVDPHDSTRVRAGLSERGALAIAVPAHVAGLCLALKQYGTLDLKSVLAPAIRLCRDGVPIDSHDIEVQKEVLEEFAKHPEYGERFGVLLRAYLNNARPWQPGDRFFSPLRDVLERIAESGPEGFYAGPVGEALVAEIERRRGLITRDDLAAAKPVVRQPLTGRFGPHTVVTMPPPSSGGLALIETLNILAEYAKAHPDWRFDAPGRSAPANLHVVAEAFKHAFADRAEFLGDADLADVPVARLIGTAHAAALAARIDAVKTQPPGSYGRFVAPDDGGTSHFSILDAQGNAVACTETINLAFGSFVVEPKFGIVMNDEMDDFAALPGVPNAFGLRQSAANAIAPRKRPLSSMTPTILVKDGRAEYVVGASGGPRIITATTQVVLDLARFEMTPAQAVAAPRIHHQWMPDELRVEKRMPGEVVSRLRDFGHAIKLTTDNAVVQAASRSPSGLRAASDPRKHGRAAGY